MWLALLWGCSGGEPAAPPDVDVLAVATEPGAWHVGYVETAITWTEPGVQDDPRELRLAVWFPTDATEGTPVRYNNLLDDPDTLGGVDPVAGPLPVAVFSHGHQAYAEGSSYIATHLASHGWLVLAPDHTGNTTFDGPDRDTEIYWQRPHDLSAVLDAASAELGFQITTEVVSLGHSFGAYTVHALAGATYATDELVPGCYDGTDTSPFCSTMDPSDEALFRAGLGDDRFLAHVSMAPGDYDLFGQGLATIEAPILLMSGGLDPSHDGAPYWAKLAGGDNRWVHLPTAGHNAFSDFSGLLDPPDAIDPEEGWRITRAYALAFVEVHGRSDPTLKPLLDGEVGVSDLAELTTP